MTEFTKSAYGVTTSETCQNGMDMLAEAGGQFNVVKQQLGFNVETPSAVTRDGQLMLSQEQRMIEAYVPVRDDTMQAISHKTVGKGYEVLQNSEVIEMVDAICEGHDLTYTNMTTLQGGAGLCVQIMSPDLNRSLKVGNDDHDGRLTITNFHDGSGSVTSHISLLRLACSNMMPAVKREFKNAKDQRSTYSIKHTRTMGERINQMVEAYRSSMGDMVNTSRILNELANKRCTENEMKDLFMRVLAADGKDESELTDRVKATRQARFADLVARSTLAENVPAGFEGTWYAALQPITDFGTRGFTVKNTKGAGKDENRFISQNFGTGSNFSLEGLKVAMELTGVS